MVIISGCGDKVKPTATLVANYVLTNGKVYTVDKTQPWAEAVAIKGNKIIFVGSSADAKKLIGKNTKVADLGGRMVMPGIIDSHLHPMLAAIAGSGLRVTGTTMDETLKEIAQYAKEHPEQEVIFGWGYHNDLFGAEGADKRLLDEIIPDRPVYIIRSDGHSAWANSKALEAAGVNKNTPDPAPPAGVFGRDASGHPTGAVNGAPANLWFMNNLPGVISVESLEGSTMSTLNDFSEHGITAAFDAGAPMATDVSYQTLDELAKTGQSPLRIQAGYYALAYDAESAVPRTIEFSKMYSSLNFSITALKITLDGVLENRKAAVFEPYLDTKDKGALNFPPEVAIRMAKEAAAAGLDIYMHTIGDRAVDLGLSIAEEVRAAGFKDTYVTLSHVQLVRKTDLPRFAKADVFLNSTSNWWQLADYYYSWLGKERTEYQSPYRSIIDEGVIFINGSDYPADPVFNPFIHMEVAVTRQGIGTPKTQPVLTPGNELTIGEAIESYTSNGAKLLRMEDQIGTLGADKLADLIVLDQNVVEIDPKQIHKTKVLMTMMDGKVRHDVLFGWGDSVDHKAPDVNLDIMCGHHGHDD
jgi:predicted amidohydrolase YtcJ